MRRKSRVSKLARGWQKLRRESTNRQRILVRSNKDVEHQCGGLRGAQVKEKRQGESGNDNGVLKSWNRVCTFIIFFFVCLCIYPSWKVFHKYSCHRARQVSSRDLKRTTDALKRENLAKLDNVAKNLQKHDSLERRKVAEKKRRAASPFFQFRASCTASPQSARSTPINDVDVQVNHFPTTTARLHAFPVSMFLFAMTRKKKRAL